MDIRMLMSLLGGSGSGESADHGNVKILSKDEEWEPTMKEAADRLVVCDNFASWCMPCKMIAPLFVDLSKKYTNVVFVKINVEEMEETAMKNGVSAMPTFTFHQRGRKIDALVGADPTRLEHMIAEHGGRVDPAFESKQKERQKADVAKKTESHGKEDHGKVVMIESRDHLQRLLKEAGGRLVVVDFYGEWCGPCKMIAPTFIEFSKKYDAVFCKVDADALDDVCDQCHIRALPTFCFFRNGKKIGEFSGANAGRLQKAIEENLK